ncbi:MAG: iron-sulfur cluster co-chaperone HscB C-terminal domain-containing protein [Phycisphaerales bacterium JB041]
MTTDPFETLGLEPCFDLDEADIQRAYLARAAACHPDLVGADPERAADAARLSAALNRARAVLADPEDRAHALLERLGGGTGDQRELPEGFLMEMMETRMEVEAAAESGDAAELHRWREWARTERSRYIERLGGMFADLGAPPAPDAVQEIRRELNAWRYIERMLEQIRG